MFQCSTHAADNGRDFLAQQQRTAPHCYDYGEQWSIPPPGTTAQPRTDSAVCDNGPEWKYLYREGALGGRNIMTSSTLQTH